MGNLVIILHDQLSRTISSLDNIDKENDTIIFYESKSYFTKFKHHKKKIVLLISAMRHFAKELEQEGFIVKYISLDSDSGSLKQVLNNISYDDVIITEPSEYYVLTEIKQIKNIIIREDSRFLASRDFFDTWAKNRSSLRMEFFYREMRVKYNILLEDSKPIGGKWNFDNENRKFPKDGVDVPTPTTFVIDDITKNVIELVKKNFSDNFGEIDNFHFAVTRQQALEVLNFFLKERLPLFGDFQDAMVTNEPWLFHSHISFYLNCGLLLPLECVFAAEDYYKKGLAPLNAVEGFIRQILGWREYIRGIYWLKMPEYKKLNFFNASRALPKFYWDANTDMNCLHNCVKETKENAYAHHIQRLMVLGNFALISGIDPSEVNEWFLIVYADAYEWVELPNVSGMILFADGGYLASKPYAAGGAYINKMSDYCRTCKYSVTKKIGDNACPFNYLYWDFLSRNRDKLAKNPRIAMMYRTYDKMDDDKKKAIMDASNNFLENI
jgi:deoxyribodipyrimidine photolyase-related protein